MHRQVSFTMEVRGGGDMTGAHIHVKRVSPFAEQNLAFDVGEVISEEGDLKVYILTATEGETSCVR